MLYFLYRYDDVQKLEREQNLAVAQCKGDRSLMVSKTLNRNIVIQIMITELLLFGCVIHSMFLALKEKLYRNCENRGGGRNFPWYSHTKLSAVQRLQKRWHSSIHTTGIWWTFTQNEWGITLKKTLTKLCCWSWSCIYKEMRKGI